MTGLEIAAIVGSIVGGVSAGGNAISQSQMNRKNRDFQREMYWTQLEQSRADYSRQLADTISMWNSQNAYNSPANQRDLLLAGGYNPHIYGGNASASSLTPGSVHHPSANTSPLPAVQFNGASLTDAPMQLLQLQQQQASLKISEQELRIKTAEADNAESYYLGRSESTWKTIEQKDAAIAISRSRVSLIETDIDYRHKMIEDISSKIGLRDVQVQDILSRIDFRKIQAGLIYLQGQNIVSQIDYREKLTQLVIQNTALSEANTRYRSLEADWLGATGVTGSGSLANVARPLFGGIAALNSSVNAALNGVVDFLIGSPPPPRRRIFNQNP